MPDQRQGCRVVLDTNVVVSALLFRRGRLAALRQAWQMEKCQPVASSQTIGELTRVLGYAKFKLDMSAVRAALHLYLPYIEVHVLKQAPQDIPPIPQCRDPKDQMFLDLAYSAKVACLVTGDEDLLVLDDPLLQDRTFRIQTPQDFLHGMGQSAPAQKQAILKKHL